MFRKFASVEVLEVKSAPERVRTASLSKFADYDDYRTDDGYLYVRVRAISSRVNKNHDGWPSSELKKAYKTFIGKPLFVDHHNHDPNRARGVIVDAALHIEDAKTSSLDPYYASAPEEHLPPTWIELLCEVDAKQFPKLAKAIIDGDIDGVSMGANVELSKCSHCGNEARSPEQYCKHVQSKGAYFDFYLPNGQKTSKRAYEDCYDIGFFELSFVFDPADETALALPGSIKSASARRELIAAIQKEGLTKEAISPGMSAERPNCPDCGSPTQVDTGIRDMTRGLGPFYTCPQCGWHGNATSFQRHPNSIPEGDLRTDQVEPRQYGVPERYFGKTVEAASKTADQNPPPQSEMTVAPEQVDTLRQEQVCPICGSDMEDGVCEVCNYEEPPEGFDNPDLSKAKEVDQQMRQQDEQQADQGLGQNAPNDIEPQPGNGPSPMPSGAMPTAQPVTSTVKSALSKYVIIEKTSASQTKRINTQERPILPVTRQLSDAPISRKVVQDAKGPVESNRKGTMNTQKTADGATAQGEGVQPDKRVDVEGVGAVSGDPLSGIEHENVEKNTGDFTAPHTDTWSGNEGDSLGQQDPVTSETGDFFTVSNTEKTADSSADLGGPIGEGISGGSAKDGGPTWDKSDAGFPDHQPARVDLDAPLKEEVGEGTTTDSNEQFRSLKVTDPVTKGENANDLGGPIGVAVAAAKAQMLTAIKVAETEIELGLTDRESKFERVAELEETSQEALEAQLETLAKVRTAGLKKAAPKQQKTAGRMPSFKPVAASFDPADHGVADINVEDSLY